MGKQLSKLDILAVSASGEGAKKLTAFLQDLKQDVASSLVGNSEDIYHKAVDKKAADANASDLATAITLANSTKVVLAAHLASTGLTGVHMVASGEAIAAADADDLATAITLANELKADYNTHLDEAGVHLADDTTNVVAAADATDLASLQTLLNEIKADYNAHVLGSMASALVG